ncbi:MAG: peptide chain release factor N(5)-glutamine methyltransferase, partial [Bacteroidales bacterium]
AKACNATVRFLTDDIRAPQHTKYRSGGYDFFVSNPPYVPEADKQYMHCNVLEHEPEIALFVPDNQALIYYQAMTGFAQKMLKPDGLLFLEIHEQKGEEIRELLARNGFWNTQIITDLNGKQRMIRSEKKQP